MTARVGGCHDSGRSSTIFLFLLRLVLFLFFQAIFQSPTHTETADTESTVLAGLQQQTTQNSSYNSQFALELGRVSRILRPVVV